MTPLPRLARPRLLPFVLALPALGFGFAHWDRALPLTGVSPFLTVLGAWTLLHAGSLWRNAALDRDEGPVLLGEAVAVPAATARWGDAALLAAPAVAWLAGPVPFAAALVCALLAWGYSHPLTAWKGHPWGGPAVNVLGYGVLSPVAGAAVVGWPPTVRGLTVLTLVAAAVLGCFFTAQAFQGEEDRRRGQRTLVATHGAWTTVRAARIALDVCFLGTAFLALIGWLPRVTVAVLPLGFWVDAALLRWEDDPRDGDAAPAVEVARRLAWTALLLLAAAFGTYAADSAAGRPVAGLGTVAGHPPDRPVLPPAELAVWEELSRVRQLRGEAGGDLGPGVPSRR